MFAWLKSDHMTSSYGHLASESDSKTPVFPLYQWTLVGETGLEPATTRPPAISSFLNLAQTLTQTMFSSISEAELCRSK